MFLEGLTKFEKDPWLNQRIGFLIPEWMRIYPHIDIRSQIQWAHVWLLENPKRDKKNYVRYLGNWMRNAEKRALENKRVVVTYSPYREPQVNEEEVMTGDDFKRLKEALRK